MGSPQSAQHGARGAPANCRKSQFQFMQYNSVPATLAEEPEACEQESSAAAEAHPTLLEALGQQGDPTGTLQDVSMPATLSEELEACEQEASAAAEAPPMQLKGLCQHSEQGGHAVAEAPPTLLEEVCQHGEPDQAAPAAAAPPTLPEELCQQGGPDQAARAAAQDTLWKLEPDACQQGHAVAEAPRSLLEELCGVLEPVESGQAPLAADSCSQEQADPKACEQVIPSVTVAPTIPLEELCQHGELTQAAPAAVPHTLEELEPFGAMQSQPAGTEAYEEHLCQQSEPHQAAPAHVPDTLEELNPGQAVDTSADKEQGSGQDSGQASMQCVNRSKSSAPHLPAPPVMPAGLWGTASGKPFQVSAGALHATQSLFGAGPELTSQRDVGEHPGPTGAREAQQPCLDREPMQEPAVSAAERSVQQPHDSTDGGRSVSPSQSPAHEGAEAETYSMEAAQGAPAPMTEAADVQRMAAGSNSFSVWGTASGKPVSFSREQMKSAAALFGDDFPTGLTQAAAEPDAGATVTWSTGSGKALSAPKRLCEEGPPGQISVPAAKSLQVGTSGAGADPSAAPHSLASDPAAPAEASADNVRAAGPAFAEGHPGDASKAAEVTPARGGEEPAAALPWQTASGKRMRVSPEGMAAAESMLGQMSASDHQLSLTTAQLPGITGLKSSSCPQAGAISPARQVGQAGVALQKPIAENGGGLDPATPMPQQPAGKAGQLSASSTGCKRRAAPSAQPPSGLPGHSRPRTGSSFKAPRKFMTPVSKFVLQQVWPAALQSSRCIETLQSLLCVSVASLLPDCSLGMHSQRLPAWQRDRQCSQAGRQARQSCPGINGHSALQGVRGNTPSRLQQASAPAALRQPLHELQGTMAGALLAEAGCTDSTRLTHILSGTCCHPDLAILTLNSRAAARHTVSDFLHHALPWNNHIVSELVLSFALLCLPFLRCTPEELHRAHDFPVLHALCLLLNGSAACADSGRGWQALGAG